MCAISVILLHMLAAFYNDAVLGNDIIERLNVFNFISFTPVNIIFNGSFSVYIFWLLSSFLIADSWYSRHDMKDMQRKMFNKYFRIIIPIIICSIIAFVMIKLKLYYHEEAGELIGNGFFLAERF